MKKLFESAFLSCGLLFLVLMGLITAFSEKETDSFYENRTLAELPASEAAALSDGSWFTGMETYLQDHAAGRESLTRLSTAMDIKLLCRPVVNDIVVQEDILLPYLDYEVPDSEALHQQAQLLSDNLETVADAVNSYGGVYCYVAVPGQYSYHQDRYPRYMNNRSDFMEASVSILSDCLAARGIPFLDLGPMYGALGSPDELSSAVDNHYSLQGAHLAYETILEYLNDVHRANFPILREDDLTFTPIDRHYLGARARKIFDLTALEETLWSATPKQPVSFIRIDNGYAVESSVYSLPEEPSEPITYSCYMGGDVAKTEICTYRSDLPTVLIYGDSYTNAMECLLYLSCDAMYSVDLRHYTEGTLTEYILETQPDYVICLRDYGVLLSTDGNGGT